MSGLSEDNNLYRQGDGELAKLIADEISADRTESLAPVTSRGEISAADNDDGFSVFENEIQGRPFVNFQYDVGGDAVIIIEGLYQTDPIEWYEYDRIDTGNNDVPNSDIIQAPWTSYLAARIRTDAANVAVEFLVSATR